MAIGGLTNITQIRTPICQYATLAYEDLVQDYVSLQVFVYGANWDRIEQLKKFVIDDAYHYHTPYWG